LNENSRNSGNEEKLWRLLDSKHFVIHNHGYDDALWMPEFGDHMPRVVVDVVEEDGVHPRDAVIPAHEHEAVAKGYNGHPNNLERERTGWNAQ
jgi:hypothetical protein